LGCAYITTLSNDAAKARGIATQRPMFGYTPGIGLFFVRPATLNEGGGSVKQ